MELINKDNLYAKVRGLLRQAESTPYQEEAILFLEKAQTMMLRYAISEEELWESEPSKRPKPVVRTIPIKSRATGAKWNRVILASCCKVSRCRCWKDKDETHVAGIETDVVFVEMLYTSITVQMNFLLATSTVAAGISGQAMKTFQNNFIEGFARRIFTRFKEIQDQREANPTTGVALVLHRTALVDRFMEDDLGIRLRHSAVSSSGARDPDAQKAGTQAANEVDLTGGSRGLAARKAIST